MLFYWNWAPHNILILSIGWRRTQHWWLINIWSSILNDIHWFVESRLRREWIGQRWLILKCISLSWFSWYSCFFWSSSSRWRHSIWSSGSTFCWLRFSLKGLTQSNCELISTWNWSNQIFIKWLDFMRCSSHSKICKTKFSIWIFSPWIYVTLISEHTAKIASTVKTDYVLAFKTFDSMWWYKFSKTTCAPNKKLSFFR